MLEFDSFDDPIQIPSIDHAHDDDPITQHPVKNPVISRPKAIQGRFETLQFFDMGLRWSKVEERTRESLRIFSRRSSAM